MAASRAIPEMGASLWKGLSSEMMTVCPPLCRTLWIFPLSAAARDTGSSEEGAQPPRKRWELGQGFTCKQPEASLHAQDRESPSRDRASCPQWACPRAPALPWRDPLEGSTVSGAQASPWPLLWLPRKGSTCCVWCSQVCDVDTWVSPPSPPPAHNTRASEQLSDQNGTKPSPAGAGVELATWRRAEP